MPTIAALDVRDGRIVRFDVDTGEIRQSSPALEAVMEDWRGVRPEAMFVDGRFWVSLAGNYHYNPLLRWATIGPDLAEWEFFEATGDFDGIPANYYLTPPLTVDDSHVYSFVTTFYYGNPVFMIRAPRTGGAYEVITSWGYEADDESNPEAVTPVIDGHCRYHTEGDYIWDIDVATGEKTLVVDLGVKDTTDDDLCGWAELPDGSRIGFAIAENRPEGDAVAWRYDGDGFHVLGVDDRVGMDYRTLQTLIGETAYSIVYDNTYGTGVLITRLTRDGIDWRHATFPDGNADLYAIPGSGIAFRVPLRQLGRPARNRWPQHATRGTRVIGAIP